MNTPNPQPSRQPHSALIIDDNWFNRDIFRIALESAGYVVTETDSGTDGLNILRQQSFNLLILDLQMPNVDGKMVLHTVRADEMHKKMHIVVVTANAHMATSDVDAMADHVMYKPINVIEFSEFVRRIKNMSVLTP
jgi:CheY-like chemotaxis protein